MELGRDINARDKSKWKVGQESYRGDNRRGRRRIIGDNKSIQLSLRLLSKHAITEMLRTRYRVHDRSTLGQLSLILSDKSWRSFKVEIPAIVMRRWRIFSFIGWAHWNCDQTQNCTVFSEKCSGRPGIYLMNFIQWNGFYIHIVSNCAVSKSKIIPGFIKITNILFIIFDM